MADEVEMDQEVYDKLIAEGKSERIARAKAKAAAVRAKRAAAGESVRVSDQKDAGGGAAKPAAAATAAAPAGGPTGGGGAMTPEERQARVQAALAQRGNGGGRAAQETRLAGQAHTHRLLAMVPPSGIQQIRGKQEDKVYTWPHLISAEFIALMAMMAFLTIFSAFAPAPLYELANPNVTPNPAKAPWYFLGLQELLLYFHSMVAGVTIPGVVGLIGLMMIPYLDKNPSVKPENRKTAFAIFTMFMIGSGTLAIVMSFFRGPGLNWTWPWADGIWFVL
jgi:menaquinol-cytochrome c reductase cytochrome b/c subunit